MLQHESIVIMCRSIRFVNSRKYLICAVIQRGKDVVRNGTRKKHFIALYPQGKRPSVHPLSALRSHHANNVRYM